MHIICRRLINIYPYSDNNHFHPFCEVSSFGVVLMEGSEKLYGWNSPLVAHFYGWNLVLWTDEKGVHGWNWMNFFPPSVCSRRRARHARDCCYCCCCVSREVHGSSPSLACSSLARWSFTKPTRRLQYPICCYYLQLKIFLYNSSSLIFKSTEKLLQRREQTERDRDRETEEMASFGFFACVEQSMVGMVEKWGRFSHVAQPGLHCLNPCLGEWMVGRPFECSPWMCAAILRLRCDTRYLSLSLCVPLFFLFFLFFPSDLIALVGSCGLWILHRFFVGLAYLRSSQPREMLSSLFRLWNLGVQFCWGNLVYRCI